MATISLTGPLHQRYPRAISVLVVLLCGLVNPLLAEDQASRGRAVAVENRSDANGAWHIFRQAVLNRDSDQAATVTTFPLEVRGQDDSDAVRYYDRKNFSAVFLRLIAQQQVLLKGNGLVRRPVVELVKEKLDVVEKDFQSSNQFRVYDFVFTPTKGRWSFVVGYLVD